MKKVELSIGRYRLLALYFTEGSQDILIDFKNPSIRKRRFNNQDLFSEEIKDNSDRDQSEIENNPESINLFQEKSKFSKALTSVSVLQKGIFIFFVVETILLVLILILVPLSINSIPLSSIVFGMGKLRYNSILSLVNIQSLDLLYANHTLSFNESVYRGNLATSAQMLESLLAQYQSISIPFFSTEMRLFDEYTQLYQYTENGYTQKNSTLFDSILTVARLSKIISNTSFSDWSKIEAERVFILRNVPAYYITSLNETITKGTRILVSSIQTVCDILTYLEILITFPIVSLLIAAIVSFCVVEKANRLLWHSIKAANLTVLAQVSLSLHQRIKKIIPNSKLLTSDRSIEKPKMSPAIKLAAIKLALILVLTLIFYIGLVFGPQAMFKPMLIDQLKNSNFGGMRRMLSPFTLFWARNAVFEAAGTPLYTLKLGECDIGSAWIEAEKRTNTYLYIEESLVESINSYRREGYEFKDYAKLIMDEACSFVTSLSNCNSSIIAKGMDSGLKKYLREVKYARELAIAKGVNDKEMIKLEKYSKAIENGFVLAPTIYNNYVGTYTGIIEENITGTVMAFVVVLIAVYIFVGKNLLIQLKESLKTEEIIIQILMKS
jgi:hypothetical protein